MIQLIYYPQKRLNLNIINSFVDKMWTKKKTLF